MPPTVDNKSFLKRANRKFEGVLLASLLLLLLTSTIDAYVSKTSHRLSNKGISWRNLYNNNKNNNNIRNDQVEVSRSELCLSPKYLPLSRSSGITSIAASTTDDVSTNNGDLSDWKEISKEVFSKDKRPIILFDGVCNLCNGGVNFALDNDSVGVFRFVSLQSKIGQSLLMRSGKKPDDISSIVLVTDRTSYFKSDAVLRIAAKLDGNPMLPFFGTVGPVVPSFLRNFIYDYVADNRYKFGESDSCRFDDDEFNDRFVPDP
eukprot:CAMPEP_0184859736 /NCGR_PEP_ID=MMETSP0580-20130426/4724_1 /TAXON_ID=1118495 /ORGANISM="Dactyliosolen fragilissimus" /LENGTH=260 /DNA_ID=CAMNT_0027356539 /DNA_START=179 /DNA_END=961 /DNA_ORIENTATION=+